REESAAIIEKGHRAADERVIRLGGVAELEARKMKLRAKHQMIDLAFKNALESLRALSGDDYVAVLASLAAQASISGNEEIILSESDREQYGRAVTLAANRLLHETPVAQSSFARLKSAAERVIRAEGLRLSDETRDIVGGLILREDKLEMDCTFETIVHRAHDDYACDVANILFS
ncbi:MAG: V-type ATP synthase subunit E family protein, partial [Clostridia bacterium]